MDTSLFRYMIKCLVEKNLPYDYLEKFKLQDVKDIIYDNKHRGGLVAGDKMFRLYLVDNFLDNNTKISQYSEYSKILYDRVFNTFTLYKKILINMLSSFEFLLLRHWIFKLKTRTLLIPKKRCFNNTTKLEDVLREHSLNLHINLRDFAFTKNFEHINDVLEMIDEIKHTICTTTTPKYTKNVLKKRKKRKLAV